VPPEARAPAARPLTSSGRGPGRGRARQPPAATVPRTQRIPGPARDAPSDAPSAAPSATTSTTTSTTTSPGTDARIRLRVYQCAHPLPEDPTSEEFARRIFSTRRFGHRLLSTFIVNQLTYVNERRPPASLAFIPSAKRSSRCSLSRSLPRGGATRAPGQADIPLRIQTQSRFYLFDEVFNDFDVPSESRGRTSIAIPEF
jgi:hypothetical protein